MLLIGSHDRSPDSHSIRTFHLSFLVLGALMMKDSCDTYYYLFMYLYDRTIILWLIDQWKERDGTTFFIRRYDNIGWRSRRNPDLIISAHWLCISYRFGSKSKEVEEILPLMLLLYKWHVSMLPFFMSGEGMKPRIITVIISPCIYSRENFSTSKYIHCNK